MSTAIVATLLGRGVLGEYAHALSCSTHAIAHARTCACACAHHMHTSHLAGVAAARGRRAGTAVVWARYRCMPQLDPSPSDPTPTPTPIPPLLLTQVLLRCCCSASAAWERGCGAARRSTACAGEAEESGAGCTSTVCSHVQSQPPTGCGHLALRPRYAPPAP